MERDIINQLVEWKNSSDRKPLLLTGVRQCGKTWAMNTFGQRYFEDVAYFVFEENQLLSSLFEYDLNVDRIIEELSIIHGKEIIVGKTLVIFDEIQACPKAITSLKYFCENKRDLHLICAGSLLGVAIKHENISFPVGKIDRMQMYPMSFSEFLRADGYEDIYKAVQKYTPDKSLPLFYTSTLEKELKYYYIVGGMPEAVLKWVSTHNFDAVDKILDNILLDYSNDFSKHAPINDIPKLGWIWDSIPKQLAKDNNKFVFSHVKAGKRYAQLEDALEWLVNAGLIHQLELVKNPMMPLSFYADATFFKVYMSDVGLLRKKSGISYKIVLEDAALYQNFKGPFTENYVLTELIKLKLHPYYWNSQNTAELDFIFEYEDKIIPVEAKADIHTRAKSYSLFCKRYNPEIGLKFSMKNMGINNVENTKTFSIPLYLIWMLETYLKK